MNRPKNVDAFLTDEMQRALEADGEKLRQITGENHGPEFRIIACSCCGGDGGHFEDGGSTRWTRCAACNGEGELEIEPETLSVDDLEFGPIYTRLGGVS